MIQDQIVKALQKVTGEKDIHLETPELKTRGDYSTNIAMQMSSKNPRDLANNIVQKLSKDLPAGKAGKSLSKSISKIEVAGGGFINFWLSKEALVTNLQEVLKKTDDYGKSLNFKGKRAMFEYGQPNTHKLPHIGHLFSYILGESLARIMEANGWQVYRANYQGDVGLHVAKCLWALEKHKLKIPNSLNKKIDLLQLMYQKGSEAYEEDRDAKKEINTVNSKIYNQDKSTAKLWSETRSWSIDYYQAFEKRLGITFDRYYFESEVGERGKLKVIKNTPKIFAKSRGACIFEGSKFGLHDRVFVTSEGNPTYEAKDLYLEELKMKEWPFDLLIISTANEQNDYFKVVFKALEQTDLELKGKLKHLGFGMVQLKTGKMSSRTGEIVGAVELVETVVEKVRALNGSEKIAEAVGIGAVKYSFLKNNPLQNVKFDIDETIAKEGNSGPYLQYTYVRTQSVLRKARNTKSEVPNKSEILNHKRLEFGKLDISHYLELRNLDFEFNEEELILLRTFSRFSGTIIDAHKSYSPNLICEYLFDLAQKFNSFYAKYRILDFSHRSSVISHFRLALTAATGQIIKNGLRLLGIEAPERM